MIKGIINKIKRILIYSSEERYVKYLRNKGISIGSGFKIRGPIKNIVIDTTRPSLVTIGDNVVVNRNFILLTHDMVAGLFRIKYSDFLPSSGPVKIGNNVRFGVNCTILKNVIIGDNCFIAAGSVVTKNIPENCIAAGVPAKVICTLDDYYERRKQQSLKEAFIYTKSIIERFGREPVVEDFPEEFPYFVSGDEVDKYPQLPIKYQLRQGYEEWQKHHKALFESFDEFIEAAKNFNP